jgi:hypothetical protein
MAAGEDHAEQVVVRVRVAVAFLGVLGYEDGEGELLLTDLGPPKPVDGLPPCRGGQPAAAVRRHLAVTPVLDGLDERVLHRVFGQADVAEACREGGPDQAGLVAVDAFELVGLEHGPVSRR